MPMSRYKVRPGDTFAAIAKAHGFGADWEPIRNYNFFRRIISSRDPTRLPAGVTLTIPRTAAEYDAAIAGLRKLLAEVDRDMAKSLTELDQYKSEADRVGTAVDITADVIFAYRGAAKAAAKLGPRYARYVVRKEVLQTAIGVADKLAGLGDSNEELLLKDGGRAIADNAIMLQAKQTIQGGKAAQSLGKNMGKSLAKKGAVTSAKALAPVEMANGIGEVVDVLCDVALALGKGAVKAVEAVAPSKLAKGVVWIQSGEHPDDTYRRMTDFVKETNQKSAQRLRDTINRLKAEKQQVYGR